VQGTTSINPAGVDTMSVGALNLSTGATGFFNGSIAEFFYTNTDIQPDGAQLDDNMVRQLAYHGPFSHPDVAKDIVEYFSLKSSSPALQRGEESKEGKFGLQAWTAVAGVQVPAEHPPLPYEYDRSIPVARMLTI
jgi:hypothetical protein